MRLPAFASLLLAGAALGACTPRVGIAAAGASAAASFATRLGETSGLGGRTITPLAIVEDSRCPDDVMCIQAGTARILVQVQRGRKAAEMVVGLDRPTDLGGAWLHLGAVCPYPLALRPVSAADYRFTFVLNDSPALPAAPIACPAR